VVIHQSVFTEKTKNADGNKCRNYTIDMFICKMLPQLMTRFCHLRKQSFIFFLLIIFSSAVLYSCNKTEEDTVSEKINDTLDTGIHKTFERGPVSVQIDVDKKEITIADRMNLSISVISDETYDVKLPGFGEKLDQFGIVDYHTSQPVIIDQKSADRIFLNRFYPVSM